LLASLPSKKLESDQKRFGNLDSVKSRHALESASFTRKHCYAPKLRQCLERALMRSIAAWRDAFWTMREAARFLAFLS
jgi:hypothetical protein